LTEAEQEVFAFIKSNKTVGTRTTMKSLDEKFSKKPYGWPLAAIQCIIAILAGREKVEAKSDANLLEDDELVRALTNTHGFGNIILEPQAIHTPSQLRQLKDFFSHFFDKPTSAQEARALGNETRDAFRECAGEFRELAAQSGQYPFLVTLTEPIQTINELVGKDYTFFIDELPKQADDLLGMKENILDPLRHFMSGPNKEIYDDATKFLQEQNANFDSISNGKPDQLREILSALDCYKGNQMREAKKLVDSLRKETDKQLQKTKEESFNKIKNLQQRLATMPGYDDLTKEQEKEIQVFFDGIENQIKKQTLIAVIREKVRQFENIEYNLMLTKINAWVSGVEEDEIQFISVNELKINLDTPYLEDKKDVDSYLAALKKAMLEAIKDNKRIRF